MRLIFCMLCVMNLIFSSPFEIDVAYKAEFTLDDWVQVQDKLRSINLSGIVDEFYPDCSDGKYSDKERFRYRMGCFMKSTIIDIKAGLLPQIIYEKIGNGSDCCVVSYASFDRGYPEYLIGILNALKQSGFDGYFYARIGGYPNPSGIEVKYAATPYGFKIPMIKEAFNLGFENVLWLDSACLPVCNCQSVFNIIKKNGCFFVGGRTCYENDWVGYFFPKARQYLQEKYNLDPLKQRMISGSIIGFNKKSKRTIKFFREYYNLLAAGIPFASELSEMFVFSCIAAVLKYPSAYYLDPYTEKLPLPVYAYTAEDHPELSYEQRQGMFLYRQNAASKVLPSE